MNLARDTADRCTEEHVISSAYPAPHIVRVRHIAKLVSVAFRWNFAAESCRSLGTGQQDGLSVTIQKAGTTLSREKYRCSPNSKCFMD